MTDTPHTHPHGVICSPGWCGSDGPNAAILDRPRCETQDCSAPATGYYYGWQGGRERACDEHAGCVDPIEESW